LRFLPEASRLGKTPQIAHRPATCRLECGAQLAEILRRGITTNDPVGLRVQRRLFDDRVKSFVRHVCLLAPGAWKDVVDIDGFVELGVAIASVASSEDLDRVRDFARIWRGVRAPPF
jgi:hypothetical protein